MVRWAVAMYCEVASDYKFSVVAATDRKELNLSRKKEKKGLEKEKDGVNETLKKEMFRLR